MNTFGKDPSAVLDYTVDWGKYWLQNTDIITASTFTADAGITVDSSSFTSTTTTVVLSGGTAGRYEVTNHITTSEGLEDERTFTVVVSEQ